MKKNVLSLTILNIIFLLFASCSNSSEKDKGVIEYAKIGVMDKI